MFGQTFDLHDLAIVALLIVLEGVLSIDNALVLGLLARKLPKPLQKKALTYGLIGAFVFRFISIGMAAWLLHWRWVKLLGGGYLVFIAVRHLFFESKEEQPEQFAMGPDQQPDIVDPATGQPIAPELAEASIQQRTIAVAARQFWMCVLVIEITDIAFAIDSILAAIGVVGSREEKLWVILIGGMLGVIVMRYAAVMFIKLLEAFPRFETAAYLLVTVIGVKLLIEFAAHGRINFHSPTSVGFWVLWLLMAGCFCTGFLPKRRSPAQGI